MKSGSGNYFNIGGRLTFTLALLIALILVGNGLVILQFESARSRIDRLTGVSQQLIAALRLQESLQLFHYQMDELVQSKDAQRFTTEAGRLSSTFLNQTLLTGRTLAYLGSEFQLDTGFLTALHTMEVTLPLQLRYLTNMAAAGDWEVARLHLDNELDRIEAITSAQVKSINQDLDEELPLAVAHMRDAQRRVVFIVPATAISTVFLAALFGWAVARRMLELRMEARIAERTRIARELHDTLLQSFQGLVLRFQAAAHLLPARVAEAKQVLESAMDQAEQALAEGRDAVQGLRSSAVESYDLADAIKSIGEEFAADPVRDRFIPLSLRVEGTPRKLQPIVRDEIYRIAGEALRNAFRHSGAMHIEVELQYDKKHFELRVRDDGKGIDSRFLSEEGSGQHFGLSGMRERAAAIGGRLTLWTFPHSGTEIELAVPGSRAYGASLRRRSRLLERFSIVRGAREP